jgi:hypothetical protein
MLSVNVQDVLVGVPSRHRDVKISPATAGKPQQIDAPCETERRSTKVCSGSYPNLLTYFPVDTD